MHGIESLYLMLLLLGKKSMFFMQKNHSKPGRKAKLPTWNTWKPKPKETDEENDPCQGNGSCKEFEYIGSVEEGTTIYYGKIRNGEHNYRTTVKKDEYQKLLETFKNKGPIKMGTSHDKPPEGSVGKWLIDNVEEAVRAIASYVGSILIHEGYAIKGKDPATIEFL